MKRSSKRALAVLLVGVVALLAFGACSSTDEATDAPSASEAAAPAQEAAAAAAPVEAAAATAVPQAAPTAAAPVAAMPKVDRLIMGVVPLSGTETNELRHSSSPTVWPFRSVYDYPIALNVETGQLMPGLAESWQIEPDGRSMRVKIREGIPFHFDWGEFTSADLVAMWKDISKEDSRHGQSGWWSSTVEDIEVVSDYELIYHPVRTDGQIIESISEIQGGAEVRSSAQVEAMGGTPEALEWAQAGTGPYQTKSREQGVNIVLERAPGTPWRGVTPDFAEFEFRFMAEVSTRLSALLTGEIHMADLPDDLRGQAVSRGMALRTAVFPGVRLFGLTYCCYLTEKKNPDSGYVHPDSPLMDLRVRKALNKAINREEMNQALFGGKGITMYQNHFNPSRPGWDPTWEQRFPEQYGYDPEAAKALLAEAGYGPNNPLQTTLLVMKVTGIASGEDLSVTVGGYWSDIGVDVNLESTDSAALRARSRAGELDNHTRMFGTGSSLWTGVAILNSSHTRSYTGFNVQPAERLLLKLIATVDPMQRDAIWRDIGNALFENHGSTHLFWLPAQATVDPEIVGDWLFPGSITGTWTHIHNIKAAG